MTTEFSIVGKPVIRQDGVEKVTGRARFADDYHVHGQLYGVMVRVPAVHAKINSIDYGKLLGHPAITAICDWNDVPGSKKVGAIRPDQPIFCYDKICTSGDVVAMLVGDSYNEIVDLAMKVKIDFESLPVLTDTRQALAPDAPLIHPDFGHNLIVHHRVRKGDVEQGFAVSDCILEQTYTTPLIEHAYLEPEAVLAIPLPGDRGIKIIGSIQNPFTARKVVAAALNWPLVQVRVEQAEPGGSFGGKDDTMNILAARAAIAALKTGRPVKIRYTREESVLESYKRHPYIMDYKVGFKRDGKISAMKIDILADGGAYASMSPFVTWRTVVQATGPYDIDHVCTDVRAVYTNNPYTGAMRGFGSPQPIFAQESIMDEIAIRLGLTPDQVRRINGFRTGSRTATGQTLQKHDVNLITVLDTAVARTNFAEKWRKNRERTLAGIPSFLIGANDPKAGIVKQNSTFIALDQVLQTGIGLALSYRGCSLGAEGVDAAAAYISVQPDGSVYLSSGLAENGQGLRTTFSIIAAEVLGISVHNVYYLEMDTTHVPDSGPTVASRSTLMGGGAVKLAAETVRHRLVRLLQKSWSLSETCELIFTNGMAYPENASQRKITFTELCSLAYNQGVNLSAIGWYAGPKISWDEAVGQGSAYFTYVYGCQVAEVTVNITTGQVYVDRIVAVHDPGRVINRLGAEGQVFGGVTQGAGYGLLEEIYPANGRIQELNFDQILIPTSQDLGEIVPIFIEGRDIYGPWGAKSLGEPTLELTAAAIANAVANAVGERYVNLPLNLEEVMLKRKLKKL